jgi:hypothetical protein
MYVNSIKIKIERNGIIFYNTHLKYSSTIWILHHRNLGENGSSNKLGKI